MSSCPLSAPVSIAVCGESVVGRALVLLLQDTYYDLKFLPAASLREPGSLVGVRLLLLTPTAGWSAWYHECLLTALEDDAVAADIPILELVALSGRTKDAGAKIESRQGVLWPCSTEELKRRIATTLCSIQ
jgi:hypothetical protein